MTTNIAPPAVAANWLDSNRLMARLAYLAQSLVDRGIAPGDSAPLRRQKAMLTLSVVLKSACCPIWIISYGVLGFYVAAVAPLVYLLLSAASVTRFFATRRFESFSSRQIALMLAMPVAMQVALGGFVAGSAVIVWALLAPLMAFLFHGVRRAVPWTIAFVALTALSGALELVGLPPAAPMPSALRETFFVLNLCAVGVIVCATVAYFADRLAAEQARSEALLLNVLPAPIAERLKGGEESIADECAAVSVVFADLVNFTGITAGCAPSEIVRTLNDVFSEFDRLVERHGLEKIKTVGDSYMAVAGLPEARPDHAEAAVELALALLAVIRDRTGPNGEPLRLRIGINTGPVVAGVIGTRKFSYDLWGDVVNTASRMESHGLPGAIQVTEATYQQLRNRYRCEERGALDIKGKGQMRTYIVAGQRPEATNRALSAL